MANYMDKKELIKLSILPVIILAIHLFSSITKLYKIYPWIDVPMHFLGGFVLAISSLYFIDLCRKKGYIKFHKSLFFLIIISLVSLGVVLWELGEFTVDITLNMNTQDGLHDTMTDVFISLIGGIAAYFIFKKYFCR